MIKKYYSNLNPFFFTILIFTLVYPSISISKQNNIQLYRDARNSFIKFNNTGFEDAISKYNKIISDDPGFYKAYAGLAETYSFKGYFNKEAKLEYEDDFNKSYNYINKAISINPTDENTLLAVAYIHLNLNRPKDALNIANKLLASQPDNYEYLYLFWAADGKKPEDSTINRILKINPNYVIAQYELAKSYYKRRSDPAKGIFYLKKALENSESENFRTLLGRMMRSNNMLYESISEFDTALKINPSFMPARINKGISVHYLQKYNESTQLLVINEEINKRFPETYYFIGTNYFLLENKEKAKAFYNKFIDLAKGQSKYNYYINKARNNLAQLN